MAFKLLPQQGILLFIVIKTRQESIIFYRNTLKLTQSSSQCLIIGSQFTDEITGLGQNTAFTKGTALGGPLLGVVHVEAGYQLAQLHDPGVDGVSPTPLDLIVCGTPPINPTVAASSSTTRITTAD
jgi:hypothetical protein